KGISLTAPKKERLLSAALARLFFAVLFCVDILWGIYAIFLFAISGIALLFASPQHLALHKWNARCWLTIKRAAVCGLSLFIALFSPSFVIMVACSYFLAYDQAGLEEVVPTSIQ